jgi:hypothetical protein
MYVVLTQHKLHDAMSDLMAELVRQFPAEKFSVFGSEEKGYQCRIEGVGDERAPRKFAITFLKTWKPKPPEIEIIMSK